jgi:hypothetical protein
VLETNVFAGPNVESPLDQAPLDQAPLDQAPLDQPPIDETGSAGAGGGGSLEPSDAAPIDVEHCVEVCANAAFSSMEDATALEFSRISAPTDGLSLDTSFGGPPRIDPPVCPIDRTLFMCAKKRKCPDDLPKDEVWLYEACLTVSTAGAFDKACKVMPSPVKELCQAAAKGGKAKCCDAVFDTKVPATWKCAFAEAGKANPKMLTCSNCCNDNWPVLGDRNATQNDTCRKSCNRASNGAWE